MPVSPGVLRTPAIFLRFEDLPGIYFSEDPGGVDEHAKKGEYRFPLGALWEKGITVGQGQAPEGGVILPALTSR
jgi:hypothetical protein